MLKIGFTGTRDGMTDAQKREVGRLLRELRRADEPAEAHHGDCVGADWDFSELLDPRHFRVVAHPGDVPAMTGHAFAHERRPALPPLTRNRNIVAACDLLIACPKRAGEEQRSGTWATVRYARKAGRKILIVYPNGGVTGEGPSGRLPEGQADG